MSKNKFLTKVQAVALFKSDILPSIKSEGKTTIRCTWNDFTDGLHRDGQISDWQVQNWTQPAFCK